MGKIRKVLTNKYFTTLIIILGICVVIEGFRKLFSKGDNKEAVKTA